MAEIILQETSLCFTLLADLYCGKCRQDKGFWEQASRFFLSSCDSLEDEDYPEDDFFDDLSLGQVKMDGGQIESSHPSCNFSGSFFVVSNTGYLFGDYDHKQRL